MLDSEARLEDFAAASLNIGGWYDVFLDGTLVSYTGMVEKGHTEYARENQKLPHRPLAARQRPQLRL